MEGLADRKPKPESVWNKLSQKERDGIIELALEKPELSPRELAVSYTDSKGQFVSESTVYRLLKAQALITSLAYILDCRLPINSNTPRVE